MGIFCVLKILLSQDIYYWFFSKKFCTWKLDFYLTLSLLFFVVTFCPQQTIRNSHDIDSKADLDRLEFSTCFIPINREIFFKIFIFNVRSVSFLLLQYVSRKRYGEKTYFNDSESDRKTTKRDENFLFANDIDESEKFFCFMNMTINWLGNDVWNWNLPGEDSVSVKRTRVTSMERDECSNFYVISAFETFFNDAKFKRHTFLIHMNFSWVCAKMTWQLISSWMLMDVEWESFYYDETG